jgi:hypothetical protein
MAGVAETKNVSDDVQHTSRRFLLVFDLNGLFVERFRKAPFTRPRHSNESASTEASTSKDDESEQQPERVDDARTNDGPVSTRTRHAKNRREVVRADFRIGNYHCYERRFAKDFLEWAHENFDVAVWSSAMPQNTMGIIDNVWGELKGKLAFILTQEHCTHVGSLKKDDGRRKPKFLKELSVVWEKFKDKGYNSTNTLLIDDSPYKVERNPPNTAIHPTPFTTAMRDWEKGLSDTGALRTYLTRLLESDSIPSFVKSNPFFDEDDFDAGSVDAHTMEAIGEKMAALNVSPKPKTTSKPKKSKKKETNEKKKSQMPIPKSVIVQSKLNVATSDAGENRKGGNSD